MSDPLDNTLVIPAMDKTSISIGDDGRLSITQKSPSGDENTILVPYAYLDVFSEVLISVIEEEVKKQKAQDAAGHFLSKFRDRV